MTWCYLQIGMFESFGTWMIYFIVMSDFGFEMKQLFGMGLASGYSHASTDVYDPYDPYFGNSNLRGACDGGQNNLGNSPYSNYYYHPDLIYNKDIALDLRMVYVTCAKDANGALTSALASTVVWGTCSAQQISSVTHRPICYSIESIKYTQTSFFVGFVAGQAGNLIAHKGRRSSIFFQGLRNYFQLFGYTAEVVLCLCLAFIPGINSGIGTRDINFLHFGVPAVPFTLFILFYDEMRKFFIAKSLNVKDGEKPGWWYRNCSW